MTNDHIIAQDATSKNPYRMQCLNCGGTKDFKTPISMTKYILEAEKFIFLHKDCKKEKGVGGGNVKS